MKQIILSIVLLVASCRSSNDAVPGKTTEDTSGHETLESLGARYGFPALPVRGKTISMKSRYTTMVFSGNSRKLLFNGILIWLNAPIVEEGGKWSMAKADAAKTIDPLLRVDNTLDSVRCSTVVLDPGHGGSDTGAIGHRKVYEKEVVLDIAERVKEELKSSSVAVKLTRENDSYISLSDRTKKAKQWRADILVSIHVNSARNSNASGIETYVLPAAGYASTAGNNDKKTYSANKHDAVNTLLAYYVHKEILARTGSADRGIKRARFDVLRDAPCPAILVECGFVSNKTEEQKMLQSEYRDNVAEGIAQGILAYAQRIKAANGK